MNSKFDFNNILLGDKSFKNILIYEISCKTYVGVLHHCVLGSIKLMDLLAFMMELDIYYYLILVEI